MAHFTAAFGSELFWGWNRVTTNEAWKTRDGVIPWKLFTVLMDDIRHVWALEKLNMLEAHTTSTALTWREEGDHEPERRLRTLLREAMGHDGR